jgi:nucleotide-binding universal stress UspA family protein
MINIDRILCPLDLSDCSHRGFEHAVALARWYDATLTVLHVFERVPVAAYAPGAGSPGAVVMPPERQAIVTELETLVRRQAGDGASIVLQTRDGRTTDEILQAARDLQSDLLVIGTHGRSGFERLVLGSVTEKVLRRAACPVLAVPPAGPLPSPVVCKRILCAVDFSKSSLAALEWATSLAQEADAHLTLLHVMDYGIHEWPEIYERFMDGQVSLEDFRTYCRESGRERLELAVPPHARTYATIETAQVAGKPYREIVRVAAERHCDLIVMGVRGPATFEHALLGSTTQQVVRLAEMPVLVVPAG